MTLLVLPIAFGSIFTILVSWSLGRVVLFRVKAILTIAEFHLLSFVTGSACLSGIVFFLAILHLAYWWILLCVGAAAVAVTMIPRQTTAHRQNFHAAQPLFQWSFYVIFSIYTVLYVCNAMAPEISPDGSTYHLGLVSRYYRAHAMERITTNMFANLPEGMEMLFLFAFAFGKHSAAALVHCTFLLALPLLIVCWARRFGVPNAGVIGAVLVFVSPVVGIDGVSAYNDVALACVVFSMFVLLEIWEKERRTALLAPVGLLSGFAYAIKYTGFVTVPIAIVFVGCRALKAATFMTATYKQRRDAALKAMTLVALYAATLIVQWTARNWIWFQNPISPFGNEVFHNPYIHVSLEQDLVKQLSNAGELPSRWLIPLEATVRGQKLVGMLGAVFLLAPVAIYSLGSPLGRRLLLMTLLFGLTYPANIGTRFLIPLLPFLGLAMGLALSRWTVVALMVMVVHAFTSWPSVLPLYCDAGAFRLRELPVRAALRLESAESWLRKRSPGYITARMVEEEVPAGEPVLAPSGTAAAYTTRDILVSYQSASNEVINDILLTPAYKWFAPTHYVAFTFPSQMVKRVKVEQTLAQKWQWSVNELRVFDRGAELSRSPSWRLAAMPNPWDVELAFDRSEVTRWRSWQPTRPGMYIELDFGSNCEVDTVVLQCSIDQEFKGLRLHGMNGDGHWEILSEEPQQYDDDAPKDLRPEALRQVSKRGVHYLLITDSDFLADDLRLQREKWGLIPVDSKVGSSLYRIQ